MFLSEIHSNIKKAKNFLSYILIGCFLVISLFSFFSFSVLAVEDPSIITTNDIDGWPDGPNVSADAAILYEMNSGTILYAKNIYAKEYPASTTKLLTSLIAYENSSLSDSVYFSSEAINAITWDSSNMGISAGSTITMEQALYGILVGSANEAANAVGEYVAGSMDSFAAAMNLRAQKLGCVNSNFKNANGLFDEDHYTCAYDLALIGAAFFSHDTLCRMSSTYSYQINDEITVYSHNQLLPRRNYAYEYLVGSKTGYTDIARQTLVSCAEKNGLKLVCVVLKEESPNQFVDTTTLFDYGFSNFTAYNISENEDKYNIRTSDFFENNKTLFVDDHFTLTPDKNAIIVLPVTAQPEDLSRSINYSTEEPILATIRYSYSGVQVGKCDVLYEKTTAQILSSDKTNHTKMIYINVKLILLWVLGITVMIILLFDLIRYVKEYHFAFFKRRRNRKKQKRGPHSEFDHYNF